MGVLEQVSPDVKYVFIFLATLGYVTVRAFQQRNVAHANLKWIPPTSYAMAVLDVYIMATVAKNGFGWPLVAVYGTAGFLGAYIAIWFHKRYVK